MRNQFKQKAVGLLALACVTSSIFAVATYSGSAEESCALTMRSGASVRIGNTQNGTGIRFAANVDENLLTITDDGVTFKTDDAVTEVGMIIVPAKAIEKVGKADVFTYLQNTYNATKAEISTQFTDSQIQKDAKGYYVAGAIVKIQDANLDLEYQAVPYTYNGTNYTYGTASDKRTISYVFNAALADTSEEGLAAKADILAKAIEMNTKLDLAVEGEIEDGLNLSDYTCAGYEIANVKFKDSEASEELAENKIDFCGDYRKAGLGKELLITYTNEKTLTVNADVWSLYIDKADELTVNALKNSSYTDGNNKYGYYKLVNDLEMTFATRVDGDSSWNPDVARFQGVFDGNGKTVNNLEVKYRSLFGVLGANAIIKDVNFTNLHYNTGYTDSSMSHAALLGSWVYGGTIENVSVTYNIPEKYTTAGTAPAWSGVLFGQVFPTGRSGCSTINLNNVEIEALNVDTAANTSWAVFGNVSQTTVTLFNANNVTVIGGSGLYYTSGTAVTEYAGIKYSTGKSIKLESLDMQIGETVDFNTMIPEEKAVQSVSYNGALLDENSVTFSEMSEASNIARTYTILTTDGEKYSVDITVWSLLIKTPADLVKNMKTAVYTSGENKYGYYKLMTDLEIPISSPVENNDTKNGAEFQGVFDGNGKTINGLYLKFGSLFGVLGKDAVIKDVKFTNVNHWPYTVDKGYSHTAILASFAYGGTIENVSVTYNIPEKYTTAGTAPAWSGVLFGQVFAYADAGVNQKYSTINLNNVKIEALNIDTTANTSWAVFGNVSQTPVTLFNAVNVTVIGGSGLYYTSGTAVTEYNGITFSKN